MKPLAQRLVYEAVILHPYLQLRCSTSEAQYPFTEQSQASRMVDAYTGLKGAGLRQLERLATSNENRRSASRSKPTSEESKKSCLKKCFYWYMSRWMQYRYS